MAFLGLCLLAAPLGARDSKDSMLERWAGPGQPKAPALLLPEALSRAWKSGFWRAVL
jgi:hypothetical protein